MSAKVYPGGMASLAEAPTKATRRMSHADLVEAADYYGVDPAGLDIEALRAEVRRVGGARWKEENREAIGEFNAWVSENGIPFSDLYPDVNGKI